MDLLRNIEETALKINEFKVSSTEYIYNSDFSKIVDSTFNIKANYFKNYLKINGFDFYYNQITEIIPIDLNVFSFIELFENFKNELISFDKFSTSPNYLNTINSIAEDFQVKYYRSDIDIIFKNYNIKCGDEFYTINSKKTYVQNVLSNTSKYKVYILAKEENFITENIAISDNVNLLSDEFINSQIKKCNNKISIGDYDGAITNARSLLEKVMYKLLENITNEEIEYNLELPVLYKKIRRKLNLDSNENKTNEAFHSIALGLTNIIHGFSTLSNSYADRHAIKYKVEKRHAYLMVNSSYLLTNFLVDSYHHQYPNNN